MRMGGPMLKFSKRAHSALKRLLDAEDHEPGQVIRLVSDVLGQFHLVFDVPKEGDQLVEHEGLLVLVVEASISRHLPDHIGGDTLDVEESQEGVRLCVLTDSDEAQRRMGLGSPEARQS